MSNEKMRCPCGWEGKTEELQEVCVFRATNGDPAEYESKCPCCDRPFDELEIVPICVTCEDIYVQEEGDVCHPCKETELAEACNFNDAPGG